MGPESAISAQERTGGSDIPKAMVEFFASQRYQGLSENTRNSYGGDLTLFMKAPEQAELTRLGQITPESISTFYGQFKAVATAARRLAAIRMFFNWATAEGKVAQNPAENLKISVKDGRQPLNYLTATEVNKLIDQATSLRDKALIIIAVRTGANISEIAALTKEDIFSPGIGVVIRIPKTNCLCSLDEGEQKIIEEFLKSHSQSKPLFMRERKRNNVPTNKPLSRGHLFTRIKNYAKAIGRPDVSPRTLRNTFIMNLQSDDPNELARHLGINSGSANLVLLKKSATISPTCRITSDSHTPQIPDP